MAASTPIAPKGGYNNIAVDFVTPPSGTLGVTGNTTTTGNVTTTGSLTAQAASVANDPYGATWSGSVQVPTKDALFQKIQSLGVGLISDAVFSTAWNGIGNVAPSQNAVYDGIRSYNLHWSTYDPGMVAGANIGVLGGGLGLYVRVMDAVIVAGTAYGLTPAAANTLTTFSVTLPVPTTLAYGQFSCIGVMGNFTGVGGSVGGNITTKRAEMAFMTPYAVNQGYNWIFFYIVTV